MTIHPLKLILHCNCIKTKVKTTQPRRYLVRPNQGIVAPNSSETISILLVDKDRQVLWSTYDRLGQSALDHSKDKFLVQSCVVSNEFAGQFKGSEKVEGGQYRKELVEALTAMWNGVASGSTDVPVYNKKLHVKHVVNASSGQDGNVDSATAAGAGGSGGLPASLSTNKQQSTDKMSPEQMYDEIASLKRKYDELVAFSVNLTAERDILNNTLEQTKRDLNREVASRQALERQNAKAGARGAGGSQEKSAGGGMSVNALILVGLLSFFIAVRATNTGAAGFLQSVPVLGGLLGFNAGVAPRGANAGVKDEL